MEDIRHDLLLTGRMVRVATRKLAYLQVSLRAVSRPDTEEESPA